MFRRLGRDSSEPAQLPYRQMSLIAPIFQFSTSPGTGRNRRTGPSKKEMVSGEGQAPALAESTDPSRSFAASGPATSFTLSPFDSAARLSRRYRASPDASRRTNHPESRVIVSSLRLSVPVTLVSPANSIFPRPTTLWPARLPVEPPVIRSSPAPGTSTTSIFCAKGRSRSRKTMNLPLVPEGSSPARPASTRISPRRSPTRQPFAIGCSTSAGAMGSGSGTSRAGSIRGSRLYRRRDPVSCLGRGAGRAAARWRRGAGAAPAGRSRAAGGFGGRDRLDE
jgi:hypothetical protein